jgi:ABC-2 type transport system ATP-binding protein
MTLHSDLATTHGRAPDDEAGAVIEVEGLVMRYGELVAVGGIDLQVGRGEVLAFLGPNGAGKTTTVEILEGYRRRTAGHVRVLGEDPANAGPDWRARVGVVLQESAAEQYLTVAECVRLYAGYYAAPRSVDDVLELVGLAPQAGQLAGRLSGGQKRRLDVALALVGNPELLFLDEPTTGFDPTARRQAWEMVEGLRTLGVTVFLTTHYMDEAEHLADRVIVIAGGSIVAEGPPQTLAGRDVAPAEIRFSLPPGVGADELPDVVRAALAGGPQDERLLATTPAPTSVLAPLTAWAAAHNWDLHDIEVRRPTLEDIYLALTAPDDAGDDA